MDIMSMLPIFLIASKLQPISLKVPKFKTFCEQADNLVALGEEIGEQIAE